MNDNPYQSPENKRPESSPKAFPTPRSNNDRGTRFLLGLCTAVFGITGVLGIVPAGLSCMLFDAPGSERNPLAWLIFFSVATYPIVAAVSLSLAWRFYHKAMDRAARRTILVPALNWIGLTIGFALANVFAPN